ncbi:MAG: hypothetical protein AAFV31_06230 [Pseudomonadota bacterium]
MTTPSVTPAAFFFVRRNKKGGDTREEVGATAKNRKPREEEGSSEVRASSREDYWTPVTLYIREMLHLHNTPVLQRCYAANAYVVLTFFWAFSALSGLSANCGLRPAKKHPSSAWDLG